jgi:hypothetical protein
LTAKITAALLLALTASALWPEREPETGVGQTLQYGVEWRLIRAGLARLNWSPQPADMQQADLHLESVGLVSKLYRVNDDYRAILDKDLCATSVLLKAEEGKRRRETQISFDGKGTVSYLERDLLKNSVVLKKELQTPACVHEYMGGLHKLRSLELDPGQSATVPLTDGKKFANVKVDAQEREQVKTPLGTFTAIRHEVHMFNGVIANRKARMYVWISDDARRLPVQIRVRMSVLVGTITLQLEKIE